MSDSNKSLISGIGRKWKLEQIPSKKLEIENKLMEERLNQLKIELAQDKSKRNSQGGTIWSKAQPGPVGNYGKTVLKSAEKKNEEDSITYKLSNRQLKLKVLKEEVLANLKETEKPNSSTATTKRQKCGQCEKNLAFCRCLECGEDYCANCFTNFHIKGALQKHRTIPIKQDNLMQKSLSNSQSFPDTNRDAYSAGSYNHNNRINSSDSTSSYLSNQNKNYNQSLLMNGSYDEKEAQESFKQAVMEWRKSNDKSSTKTVKINETKNKTYMTPKETAIVSARVDANVGSDQNDLRYKQIENMVNSNHSLTYAERILLQKHRRNELDFNLNENTNYQYNNGINSNNGDLVNGSHSEHINFKDIMRAVNIDEINEDVCFNKNNNVDKKVDQSIQIEEIETKNNIIKLNKIDERLLTPDLLETKQNNSSKTLQYSKSRSSLTIKLNKENLDEIPKSARHLNSARIKSARNEKNNNLDKIDKTESYLTRVTSPRLKALTNRETNMFINESNGIGQFILMDVIEKEKNKNNNSRPSSSNSNINKLSYKFYVMSPNSWRPSSSLSLNFKETKIKESQIVQTSLEQSNSTPIKSTKSSMPKKIISQSIDFKNSSKTNSNKNESLKIELKRHKTFVSPTSKSLAITKPNRPVSATTGSFVFGNKQNIEFGNKFASYDIDDGRSSKICQNEEDDDYYGKLEVEFNSTVHRTVDKNLIREAMQNNTIDYVKNETDYKKISENFDLLIRNENYNEDCDDMENLDLEELKSLC